MIKIFFNFGIPLSDNDNYLYGSKAYPFFQDILEDFMSDKEWIRYIRFNPTSYYSNKFHLVLHFCVLDPVFNGSVISNIIENNLDLWMERYNYDIFMLSLDSKLSYFIKRGAYI